MNQREAFVATATELLERDPRVCVLLGDISVFAFRDAMARWPERALNVGIMECAMTGMAAGLAREGFWPIIHTIDSFQVRRAYEFIRLDFGENCLKGAFVTVGHDHDYETLGASHWCPEGPKLMACVPSMCIYEPRNADGAASYIRKAHERKELAYIRLSNRNET